MTGDSYLNTGGVYEPYSNYWVGTALTDAPAGRKYHTAVWTGDQMIVWGGTYHSGIGELKDGGRYNPSGNSWTQTTDTNAPSARESHTAVWTGSEMIVWGGSDGFDYLDTGGRYDPNPAGDSWKATDSGLNIPSARDFHTAVWTGSEMIVWGGYDGSQFVKTGGRYDPATDSWMPTGIDENTPSGREYHTAVWDNTDGVMIVWGGVDEYGNYLNDGGRYSPGTYAWLPLSGDGAPIGRAYHTAVWTGTEMVVWGGIDQDSNYMNDGGQYDPFLESWMPIATTDAPAGRTNHTAVWTGSEMIVWGGTDQTYYPVNDGGRYDPFLHSWLPISTKNAPTGRQNHTAVWTGYMMIVWGGDDGYYNYLNDGGQYDPLTDRWTEVSTKFAPSGRSYHTAVWSLGVMIVWGGLAIVISTPAAYMNHTAITGWVPR
ncbi:MAG: hypothetical protein NT009_08110 [Proteobacteria bacterium]|nr:hypothetical protein [Pseudomonadota bacterium]